MMSNNSALGRGWEEVEKELFTPKEIEESNLRVALIGKFIEARDEGKISQKKFAELTEQVSGRDWDEVKKEFSNLEEIIQSDLSVSLIEELVKARQEKGITQKKLEELSGVRQPVIARIEKGRSSPNLDTLLKVLKSLGKTLKVVDLKTN